MFRKHVLAISILLFSLFFSLGGMAGEERNGGASKGRDCPACPSASNKEKKEERKIAEAKKIGCFGCNRKPCSATRTTWIQLYRKLTGSEKKPVLSSTKKEQTK